MVEGRGSTLVHLLVVALCLVAFGFAIAAERRRSVQVLRALVPLLLETLLKQEEDQDLDKGAWSIVMAGGTCLSLIVHTVGDDIVPLVMPFVEENITKPDWRQREAAFYAFGSILEGPSPSKLAPLINHALPFMLSALVKDPTDETAPLVLQLVSIIMMELRKCLEEYQVCAVTVGMVGDICRALEDKILPYCEAPIILMHW